MRIKLFILTFLFLFFGVSPVFADSVLLNEIMANPISPEKEWVELYNNSPSNMDITRWVITELTSSGNINSHSLPSVTIPSLSSCFFEFSSAVLNNDGDTVSLNNSSGTQIDSYTYTRTTSGKTFSRIPDGGVWQTSLTDPTKSSTDCNNLLSNSPTPTPAPSPSVIPTTTPAATPQATTSFTISNVLPSEINSNQSFSVNINLSMPNSQNTDYYLKGAFKKSDGTRYLGLTKNGNNWIEYGDDDLKQYKITTDSSSAWTGSLEVKPDTLDKDYKGSGVYTFKVVRLTSGGSATWSNDATVKINDTGNTPSSNPSPQATVTPKISPSASSFLAKPQSPTQQPTSTLKSSYRIASVAGTQTATPEGKVEVKNQKQTNPFLWIGLIFIFAGSGAVGYIYLKKNGKLRF